MSGPRAGREAATSRERKRRGVVYTPAPLARFLARRALAVVGPPRDAGPLVVLDPACGDGALLAAMRAEAPGRPLDLRGIDVDRTALEAARRRLGPDPRLERSDVLDAPADGPADVVIANPPYVRTQALGADRAAALRRRFGLVGRVDLLHAVVAAVAERLRPGGALALLASNRFLTTRAGAGLRRHLAERFEVLDVIDLGDTKPFDAAVLPAVVIARRVDGAGFAPRGVRVHLAASRGPAPPPDAVVRAIEAGGAPTGLRLETGVVGRDDEEGPWRITPPDEARWTVRVRRALPATFADLAHVRVGVKTTADDVFVRDSFADLPPQERPEASLVRPLLRREHAAPFVPLPGGPRELLYPHERRGGRRVAVDLAAHPRATAWLERHRARLETRSYLRRAGRRWYEVWVPHDPEGWRAEKVVFPDISERPLFYLDRSGAVVPGNCYWIVPRDGDPRVLRLVLAIANSSVALRWYDATCANRLYHGRRRFITQYVTRFPLPDPDGPDARDLVLRVEERLRRGVDPSADAVVDRAVGRIVR
ncbi:MAG: Eco57I restriction-modification methylase domain-containing protein [Planctomycetota bacterium JB042]